MKILSVFLFTALFAISAHAGSMDGKNPHDGKMGGCASKNKMAGVIHLDKKEGHKAHAKLVQQEQQAEKTHDIKQLIEQSI